MTTESELRQAARELLESKRVQVVIGYGRGTQEGRTTPVFITDPARVEQLVCNDRCYNNLSRYLRKPEVKALGKPALVVKGCDRRAVNELAAENQIKRDELVLIGVACSGLAAETASPDGSGRLLHKCAGCQVQLPSGCDIVVGAVLAPAEPSAAALDAEIARLEALAPAERWAFWKAEFDRCIRCYACRQICPLCFCPSCITEKSTPQWISSSSTSAGNFAWHVIRAFHLAGRCSGCQECARACPVDIRLDLLNRKLELEIKRAFGFEAGQSTEAKPPLAVYQPNDNQDFIK